MALYACLLPMILIWIRIVSFVDPEPGGRNGTDQVDPYHTVSTEKSSDCQIIL